MAAISLAVSKTDKMGNTKIDTEKIKQNISNQMIDEIIGKVTYQNQSVRLKVTYELKCDANSGEIKFFHHPV